MNIRYFDSGGKNENTEIKHFTNDKTDREGNNRYKGLMAVAKNILSWVNNFGSKFKSSFTGKDYIPELHEGDDYKDAIVIRKKNHRIYYYDKDGNLAFTSSVATGKNEGVAKEPGGVKQKTGDGDMITPVGKFKTIQYQTNGNPEYFGYNRFIRLNYPGGIGIHGDANQPEAIGTNASHGCIRMPNGELVKLTNLLTNNSNKMSSRKVYILDENDRYRNGGKLMRKKYYAR